MAWIALLLSLSNVTSAATLSPPSNTLEPGSDTQDAPGASETPEAKQDEYADRPVTIEARLGIGSPTGVVGGAISYSPIPAVGLECGAGSNTIGLQLECAARGRLVLEERYQKNGGWAALTLTSGFSTGRYVDSHPFEKFTAADGPGPAVRSYQRAYWWNTDLGVEDRYESLVLRFYAGLGMLLNPDEGTNLVTHDEHIDPISTSVFYFGFGLGLAP